MVWFVLSELTERPWFAAVRRLDGALYERRADAVLESYAVLYATLREAEAADLPTLLALELTGLKLRVAETALRGVLPEGQRIGLMHDLKLLTSLARRPWQAEAEALAGTLPPLSGLAKERPSALRDALKCAATPELLQTLLAHYRQHGSGVLAHYRALRYSAGQLYGIAHPSEPELSQLVGLTPLLTRLLANTEAFVAGHAAHNVLLYGPRGSGKSTAVRGLLPRYAARGLRLIELPPSELPHLPKLAEELRFRPQRYILFVDDLSFEPDHSYQPIKSLLEGSLTLRPDNLLVYATSNRRHLVRELFGERPDPVSDDVHAWDTVHEQLALADRFGLTLTFPSATQQRYLEIVRELASRRRLACLDLETRAIRFAEWGNGYSGRTARQFVDSVEASLA